MASARLERKNDAVLALLKQQRAYGDGPWVDTMRLASEVDTIMGYHSTLRTCKRLVRIGLVAGRKMRQSHEWPRHKRWGKGSKRQSKWWEWRLTTDEERRRRLVDQARRQLDDMGVTVHDLTL